MNAFKQEGVIAWSILLVFPLGLFLMWKYARWRNRFKWLWTVLIPLFWFMFVFVDIRFE